MMWLLKFISLCGAALLSMVISQTAPANDDINLAKVDESFLKGLTDLNSRKPIKASAAFEELLELSNAPRIKLELGRAYLASGKILKSINIFRNVLDSYQLPNNVIKNVSSIYEEAKDYLMVPYLDIDVGIDSNPYKVPKKQAVTLFGGLPMTYDPGEKAGSQGYLTTTVGTKGNHSRLFNYDFYVQNTSYEISKDLGVSKYGLKVSSLWGDDTTHIRTTIGAGRVDKYEQTDGVEYDANFSINPNVFVTSPTTISGSYLTYQSDDSQTDYNLSALSISKRYQFDNANFVTPSIYADFYEPLRSTGAYNSVRAAIEYPFILRNMNLKANVSFEDRRYRNRDFMFGAFRSDQTSVVAVTIPINGFYFTIGYEQLESSISFYDYSRYTVKTGASIH